jgi:hypothetical protein
MLQRIHEDKTAAGLQHARTFARKTLRRTFGGNSWNTNMLVRSSWLWSRTGRASAFPTCPPLHWLDPASLSLICDQCFKCPFANLTYASDISIPKIGSRGQTCLAESKNRPVPQPTFIRLSLRWSRPANTSWSCGRACRLIALAEPLKRTSTWVSYSSAELDFSLWRAVSASSRAQDCGRYTKRRAEAALPRRLLV